MCISPGSVVSSAAQLTQGIADYQTGNANAKFAQMEGRSASEAANQESQQIHNAGERAIGSIQARQAANGVDLSTGSAADVTAESARNVELDRLNALHAGQLKAWSKTVEANIYKSQAKTGLVTGALKATGTLLGGSGGGGFDIGGSGGGAGISQNMMAVG